MKVIFENMYGDQLNVTQNSSYDLISLTGLTPPTAAINTSTVATADGSFFNSSRANERNLVATIVPKGNLEQCRIELYNIFKVKRKIKMYYSTDLRDMYIEGYVETFEGDLFTQKQQYQISIICPQPYFQAVEDIITSFASTISLFEFPFSIAAEGIEISSMSTEPEQSIINPGDEETGIIIELTARGNVVEPTIYNKDTRESFSFALELTAGDKVIINTMRGQKSIVSVVDGVTTNIINTVYQGSKWFQLKTGDNLFTYSCVFGIQNLDVVVRLSPAYEGV